MNEYCLHYSLSLGNDENKLVIHENQSEIQFHDTIHFCNYYY